MDLHKNTFNFAGEFRWFWLRPLVKQMHRYCTAEPKHTRAHRTTRSFVSSSSLSSSSPSSSLQSYTIYMHVTSAVPIFISKLKRTDTFAALAQTPRIFQNGIINACINYSCTIAISYQQHANISINVDAIFVTSVAFRRRHYRHRHRPVGFRIFVHVQRVAAICGEPNSW